ncbi:hypothetical protein [Mycobacterium asiaticum]|uniref:hypothetical protein n=1 Tax=Mycobacterium asiaticum TaxID=1790 RepID=UPI0015600B47|nr:hypothetical protein [Mycobacterium asiaticum]
MDNALVRLPIPVLQQGVTHIEDAIEDPTVDLSAVLGGQHRDQPGAAYLASLLARYWLGYFRRSATI